MGGAVYNACSELFYIEPNKLITSLRFATLIIRHVLIETAGSIWEFCFSCPFTLTTAWTDGETEAAE